MEKIIRIKRKESNSRLPKEVISESVTKIGGAITSSGVVLTGLTFDEQKKYMPQLVGVKEDHPEFTQRVEKFFSNISLAVPFEGLKLNITVNENGEPQSPREWISYKFCLASKQVANSKAEVYSDPNYLCYIEDEVANEKVKAASLQVKKEAYIEYAKISEDEVKFDWIIRVLAKVYNDSANAVAKLSKDQRDIKMSEYVDKNPAKFIEICKDKDLEFRAQIESMVDKGVLQRIGNRLINGSEPIGEDVDSAIAYLKQSTNAQTYAILLARLGELQGTPKVYKKEKTK